MSLLGSSSSRLFVLCVSAVSAAIADAAPDADFTGSIGSLSGGTRVRRRRSVMTLAGNSAALILPSRGLLGSGLASRRF